MGKPWENGDLYGKSPFFMGTSTISMAIFNCKMLVHQRVPTKSYLNGENEENPLEDGVPIFRHTQMVSPW